MPIPIIGGLLAKFALTRAGKVLKRIPKWAWIALAVVIVGFIAYRIHDGKVDRFETTTRQDERIKVNKEWQAKFDKMRREAAAWKSKYESASSLLATARRKEHEETLRNDAIRASGLLNSGPGAARCRQVDNSGTSSGAGGRNSGSGPIVSELAGMPATQPLAVVPWIELVKRGQLCDANRSEVTTWRKHDAEQKALRDKLIAEGTSK